MSEAIELTTFKLRECSCIEFIAANADINAWLRLQPGFISRRIYDPSGISDRELDLYASAYTAPGAMRAGFELYRAFDRDIEDNRAALAQNGKLTMPVLAVGGEASTKGPLMAEMMREVAETVTELRVSRAAHWIAEENPEGFLDGLKTFLPVRQRSGSAV